MMKSPVPAVCSIIEPSVEPMVGERVWQGRADQASVWPDIIVTKISSMPTPQGEGMDGPGPVNEARVSVNCRARTYQEAEDISNLVLQGMDNTGKGSWRGQIGGIDIQDCRLVSDMNQFDDTSAVCQRILDFRLFWTDI